MLLEIEMYRPRSAIPTNTEVLSIYATAKFTLYIVFLYLVYILYMIFKLYVIV